MFLNDVDLQSQEVHADKKILQNILQTSKDSASGDIKHILVKIMINLHFIDDLNLILIFLDDDLKCMMKLRNMIKQPNS